MRPGAPSRSCWIAATWASRSSWGIPAPPPTSCRHGCRCVSPTSPSAAARRSRRCRCWTARWPARSPPRLVIISFDPGHFSQPDMFWERSVRFGFVTDHGYRRRCARRRAQTGDPSVYDAHSSTGAAPVARLAVPECAFRRCIFPAWRMAACFCAGGAINRRWHATLAARGHYYFGIDPGSSMVALDGHMDAFRPLPILDLVLRPHSGGA